MLSFGIRLKQARARVGASQKQLAEHMNVSVPYISDIERSIRPPPVPAKMKLATGLLGDVDVAVLTDCACAERGHVYLSFENAKINKCELGVALAVVWDTLDEATAVRMINALGRYGRADD